MGGEQADAELSAAIALYRTMNMTFVETAFSMIKGKFGDAVRSKSNIGQLHEVLCKVLCHNLCIIIQAIHELGIEPNFDGSDLHSSTQFSIESEKA